MTDFQDPKTDWAELFAEWWDRWVAFCQSPAPWLGLALGSLVASLHLFVNESELVAASVLIVVVVVMMFQYERKFEGW